MHFAQGTKSRSYSQLASPNFWVADFATHVASFLSSFLASFLKKKKPLTFILKKKIEPRYVRPRLRTDALFQLQLCWVKSYPPRSSRSLPPFPRKNSCATWLSLPSASEVGMKSLRVKRAEQETSFTCLLRTETLRGESRDPGWESVTLSVDPRRNGTQEVRDASRRRRRWACQRAVLHGGICRKLFCLHLSGPNRRRAVVVFYSFVLC